VTRLVFFLIPGLLACEMAFAADEKKPEKTNEPPRVTVVLPLGVAAASTNTIMIRGFNLTNVTELRFADVKESPSYKVKSSGKADVPKDQDAKKWGDTQLKVELSLPRSFPAGTNTFTLISTNGESQPHTLVVILADQLVLEKEPNASFRQAQSIAFGKTIQGAISEAKDVDVFKFNVKAGAEIRAEVFAARYGSLLDSILTLYDDQAHIIASSDDSDAGVDAALIAKIPAEGAYFLSLIDAHDRGGAVCVYHLRVSSD
jgi:hypothetical protein